MKILTMLLLAGIGLQSFGQCELGIYTFSGSANDITGNANHAVSIGATLTSDRFGNPNSAYEFDGVNDYIFIANMLDLSQETEFTISAWFYSTNTNSTNRYAGVSYGRKQDGELVLRSGDPSQTRFQAVLASGGNSGTNTNSSWVRSDDPYLLNQWYHLVGVFKNNSVELWLNGVRQIYTGGNNLGGNFSALPSTADFWIGKAENPNVTKFFKGKIDDVVLYKCAIDSVQVNSLYQSTSLSSAERIKEFSNVKLFPNPVKSLIIIEGVSGLEALTPSITDIAGRLIQNFDFEKSGNAFHLNVSNLKLGAYILKLTDATGNFSTFQIMKN